MAVKARTAMVTLGVMLGLAVAGGAPGSGRNRIDRIMWGLDSCAVRGETPPAIEGTVVDIRLEDGRAAGTGGVNRFTAGYRLHENTLVFSAVASTKMAGPQEHMDQETAFFANLEATQYYRLEQGRLELLDASKEVVLTFTAK